MTPEGTIPWCGVKGESLAGQSFSCHNSRVSLPRISLFSSPSCAAGQRPSSAISEVMPVPHPGCFPKECVLHPKSIRGDKRQKKKSMQKHQEREWKAPVKLCATTSAEIQPGFDHFWLLQDILPGGTNPGIPKLTYFLSPLDVRCSLCPPQARLLSPGHKILNFLMEPRLCCLPLMFLHQRELPRVFQGWMEPKKHFLSISSQNPSEELIVWLHPELISLDLGWFAGSIFRSVVPLCFLGREGSSPWCCTRAIPGHDPWGCFLHQILGF